MRCCSTIIRSMALRHLTSLGQTRSITISHASALNFTLTKYSSIIISCMRSARRVRRERKGSLEMAAVNSAARCVMESHFEGQQNNGTVDHLKKLYPAVNEEKTPLPRAWSPKEKYNLIGLSQNNLRVHYKGERESMIFSRLLLGFCGVCPSGMW